MSQNHLSPETPPSSEEIKKILNELDSFIVRLARAYAPHTTIQAEMRHLETEDVAQEVRIKLWRRLQRVRIANPRAYVKKITYNQVIDVKRRTKPLLALDINDDGEVCQGDAIITDLTSTRDPAQAFEEKETLSNYLKDALEDMSTLPRRQREAMSYLLKEEIADVLPSIDGVHQQIPPDIATELEAPQGDAQPLDSDELQRLRASLSIVRQKLRAKRQRGTSSF